MVCAAELNEGEFVLFDGGVVRVTQLTPVVPPEIGPDGKAKLKLAFEDSEGNAKSYVAVASEDFQLEDDPERASQPRRRAGVSAETGVDMSNWKKVVVPKSETDRAQLIKCVQNNVFFEHLDEAEQDELADVVFEKSFSAGDVLMKEGDEGDLFYIIGEGEADIYVLDETGNEVLVRSCKEGDSFGELALMYNAPRNATVKAKTNLRCWCMDRQSFRYVIMGGSIKKRQRYLGFLDSVEILTDMDKSDKMKLVDALIPRKVESGTVIVRQGDTGDMFYILERGVVEVTQLTPQGNVEVVNKKSAGAYFGEIALMADMPRSATITAVESSVLLTLDRKTFVALLGPQQSTLRRHVSVYKTFVDYSGV